MFTLLLSRFLRICENSVVDVSECHGGQQVAQEVQSCSQTSSCNLGHWSAWQQWTSCSKTCGMGYTNRSRNCIVDPGESTKHVWVADHQNSRQTSAQRLICSLNPLFLNRQQPLLHYEQPASCTTIKKFHKAVNASARLSEGKNTVR